MVGVSSYDSPELRLTFSAKDALDMAHAIEVGGKQLFGVDRLHIHTFASGTAQEPQKESIRRAFETVAKEAGAADVVLIYLSGHGVAGPAGSDAYYYLTREARSLRPYDDPILRDQSTISSAELRNWLGRKGMPLKQVVILDTCAAGNAGAELSKISERKELTSDQRRAIELLKDATGSHIMMGSAADKVSYEASRYGQGLLTYALLLGMRGEALEEGGRLQVRRWFDTARPHVLEYASGIGGIQEPIISSPTGQTFPIALMSAADRAQIPLSQLKPQLLSVVCLDENLTDRLHLTGPVRASLRAATRPVMRGGDASYVPLVYLDDISDDIPGAYKPQVIYDSQTNHFRVRLLRGDKVAAQRDVDLPKQAGSEALAERIVQLFFEILPKA